MDYFSTHYFVRPQYVDLEDFYYIPAKGIKTYSQYNYLKHGIASFFRARHFEYALRLTKGYFNRCNVIDFGCADGPFLPSLAKYFNYVVGIDTEPKFVELAVRLAKSLELKNAELICNRNLTFQDLRTRLGGQKYEILFLLETLEHIGDKSDIWNSKISFLEELFTLIDKTGLIVISVPNMIGVSFLLQRLGLLFSNSEREIISKTNLLRASFSDYTTDLEQQWQPWQMGKIGHLGFNHLKLEEYLKKAFQVSRTNIFFQILYTCRRKGFNV
jgi:2-polyprenyl-3-methyl-5-hydroxy-6-metoxy-1,4-benzoquinol methylase